MCKCVSGKFVSLVLMMSIIIVSLEFGYAQQPLMGPEGMVVLETCRMPDGKIFSKPLVISQPMVIVRIEGPGMGFVIVRVERGKEIEVLNVSAPSGAKEKELLPGTYKVYPRFPDFSPEGGFDQCVRIYLMPAK